MKKYSNQEIKEFISKPLFNEAVILNKVHLAQKLIEILTKNNFLVRIQLAIPKCYFEKFKTIKFYGIGFKISFDTEGYLKYKYGKDWRIPKKKWNPWREDGAIINAKSE